MLSSTLTIFYLESLPKHSKGSAALYTYWHKNCVNHACYLLTSVYLSLSPRELNEPKNAEYALVANIFWCFPLHESRGKPLTFIATILTDL